jgi:enoyl-CoA hydratase/carnithine racemase
LTDELVRELTGETISAARARELGLVNAVVASDDVLGLALDFADRIARNGPLAVAARAGVAGPVS